MSDFISAGPAPGVPLRAFSAPREVRELPPPAYLAQDVREAERRGWLYGLGDVWQITDAGWLIANAPTSQRRSPKLIKVGRWQPRMSVGVGCDECRQRGYYMGGGGGALKCPYCPTAYDEVDVTPDPPPPDKG